MELAFQTGNEIYVYGDLDDDGFYMGELNGVRGLVPSNFLTEAPDQPSQGQLPPGNRRPPGQSQGPGVRGPPPPPREPPPTGHRRGKGKNLKLIAIRSFIHYDAANYGKNSSSSQVHKVAGTFTIILQLCEAK